MSIRWCGRLLAILAAVVAIVFISAATSCTSVSPFRTQMGQAAPCVPLLRDENNKDLASTDPRFGSVNTSCATYTEELAPAQGDIPGYDLHFVEFDDQGRLYRKPGAMELPIDRFLAQLRDTSSMGKTADRVSVVVFVHGWKHNAESDDDNVRWFRAMLDYISTIESASNCSRRVVGLYVGWRGDATSLPDPLKNPTFWTRKAAASRVADGEVRELFGRIRAIEDIRNEDWNRVVRASLDHPADSSAAPAVVACDKKMRLTIVGHSFGGLIVYNALGPTLIRDIGDLNERILHAKDPMADPYLSREGDLIVTINPAVEAASFVPLWQAAHNMNPRSYHAPVFVSITSDDDSATGMAFPIARFFNTIFNRYPPGNTQERAAARDTIGHDSDVIDYRLNEISIINRETALKPPPGWKPIVADADCDKVAGQSDLKARFTAESQRLDALGDALEKQRDANKLSSDYFPRQFCVRTTPDHDSALALVANPGVNLNTPVWNIETATPVVDNHSDLLNPLLIDVLRQLYEEGTKPQTAVVMLRDKKLLKAEPSAPMQ